MKEKAKKILVYFAIFFAMGTIITITGLCVLENFVYSLTQTSGITSTNTTNVAEMSNGNPRILLTDDMKSVQYSFNNQYYTYIKDDKIYINSLKDGTNVDIIEEEQKICYYNLLYDKNLILYFTQEDTKNGAKLVLRTYEIATQRKSKYNNINVTNFSRIKDMNMSPIINIIYINVETKSGMYTNNILYRIDLFNDMGIYKSGTIMEKMIMLQHKDRIYYEDTKANIYSGNYRLNLFKEDVDMIGIDKDDVLYFLSKEHKNKVYKVENNKVTQKLELSDTDVVTTYTNNDGVYIIYPTYVINVAAKDPYRRIASLSNFVTFEAIKGNKIYLKSANHLLISADILEEE